MSLSCKELKKEYEVLISLREEFCLSLESASQENLSDVFKLRTNLEQKLSSLWENFSNIPKEWREFYKTEFNIDLSRTIVKIPEKKEGFDKLIIIAKGITHDETYRACEKYFTCHTTNDFNSLDVAITHSIRKPIQTYAIWVKDQTGSDENLKDKSANDIKEKNINTMTLLERLVMELKYYLETKQHLDRREGFTLCTGSHTLDGDVARVHYEEDGFKIGWCLSKYHRKTYGSREVVS